MHRLSLVPAVAVALVLAACSGPADDPAPTSAAPTTTPPGTASPAPSATAERAGGVYLALGDSLAAGYQPGGAELRDSAYPALAAARIDREGEALTVENLACSGETTTTFLDGGQCDGPSQLARAEKVLGEPDREVRLVTIDIGGNDLLHCVDPQRQAVDEGCAAAGLRTVRTNLPTILQRLRSAAGPDVPVLVLGYYNPWLAASYLGAGSDQLAVATRAYSDLSSAITKAARDAGAVPVPLTSAFRLDDETPTRFGGREVPTNVAQVCTLTYICTAFDIHLTDEGAAVVARVVARAAAKAGVG